ncbi:hypothetical protein EVAR_13752_1 [Eumeta japonica]|uniref:Uncharacterized protein n=1 Tax=Eumeta variegata TaxID=151549 RepID=A0A4C1UD02_EUMVA|nr:hypothetical protein EVAR_13752_1 [Eumeta japonica]
MIRSGPQSSPRRRRAQAPSPLLRNEKFIERQVSVEGPYTHSEPLTIICVRDSPYIHPNGIRYLDFEQTCAHVVIYFRAEGRSREQCEQIEPSRLRVSRAINLYRNNIDARAPPPAVESGADDGVREDGRIHKGCNAPAPRKSRSLPE